MSESKKKKEGFHACYSVYLAAVRGFCVVYKNDLTGDELKATYVTSNEREARIYCSKIKDAVYKGYYEGYRCLRIAAS